ncbi:methionine aminopeptidase 1A [Citrus sinensis]|nr:methionine aminopeptidase 1A [Citrus sinensis]
MAGGSDAAETTSLSCVRCGKPAHLQCPKCMELKLPREGAAFCSQDCFKASWTSHKSVHLKAKLSAPGTGENSSLVSEGWRYCIKKGQARTPKLPHFDWTGTLRPYPISSKLTVPAYIELPDWALDGTPKVEPNSDLQHVVEIKTPDQIERMRETCRIAREVLDAAARMIRPGVTTDEIDRVVHEATITAGSDLSNAVIVTYEDTPLLSIIISSQSLAARRSVNEVICHGIPDSRKLEDGDIVNIDVTVYYKGVHGDLNETYFVGNADEASRQLVQCTYECLEKAISIVKPGVRFREIGEVINRHATMSGFSVVKSYCGHGIGELFHCAPNIPHYSRNKAVGVMKVGQTFTIEPMINAGIPWTSREVVVAVSWSSGTSMVCGMQLACRTLMSTAGWDRLGCVLTLFSVVGLEDVVEAEHQSKVAGFVWFGSSAYASGHGPWVWFVVAGLPQLNLSDCNSLLFFSQHLKSIQFIVGVWRDRMWPDGWTAVTADGKRSAQFEHTLLVTETGVEVLTARLPSSPKVRSVNAKSKMDFGPLLTLAVEFVKINLFVMGAQ